MWEVFVKSRTCLMREFTFEMQVKYRMRKKFSSVSYENDFKDSLFI